MHRPLAAALALGLACTAAAETLRLWPGTPPGDQGGLLPEGDTTKDTDNLVAGRRLIRLGHVSGAHAHLLPRARGHGQRRVRARLPRRRVPHPRA